MAVVIPVTWVSNSYSLAFHLQNKQAFYAVVRATNQEVHVRQLSFGSLNQVESENDAAWETLDKEMFSSDQYEKIAAHLRAIGKASA